MIIMLMQNITNGDLRIKNNLIDDLQILNIDSVSFEDDGEGYKIRYGNTVFYPDD